MRVGKHRHACAAYPGNAKWTWKPPNIWLQLAFVCFRLSIQTTTLAESTGMNRTSSRMAGEMWGVCVYQPWLQRWREGLTSSFQNELLAQWAAILIAFGLTTVSVEAHLPYPTQGCIKVTHPFRIPHDLQISLDIGSGNELKLCQNLEDAARKGTSLPYFRNSASSSGWEGQGEWRKENPRHIKIKLIYSRQFLESSFYFPKIWCCWFLPPLVIQFNMKFHCLVPFFN